MCLNDSIDIDLSKELMQPSKATLERQVAAARRSLAEEATAKVCILLNTYMWI